MESVITDKFNCEVSSIYRWTTTFPIRKQNFTCNDPEISYVRDDPSYSSFAFNAAVPTSVIYILSFCIPPVVVSKSYVYCFVFLTISAFELLCINDYFSLPFNYLSNIIFQNLQLKNNNKKCIYIRVYLHFLCESLNEPLHMP